VRGRGQTAGRTRPADPDRPALPGERPTGTRPGRHRVRAWEWGDRHHEPVRPDHPRPPGPGHRRRDTPARDLSEGQKLAPALAIQLTAAPRILLLDEPT